MNKGGRKMKLQNKVAIVTGSTSGIGKAAAIALAKEGASVTVTGRRQALGEEVVERIQKNGGEAIYLFEFPWKRRIIIKQGTY